MQTVVVRGRPAQSVDPVAELLASSADALRRAEWASSAAFRYELAYLAALRSGAAVLARCARPRSLRTRPQGMWGLLAATAPEMSEWAQFFAVCGARSTQLQEGRAAVSVREADDLVREAAAFAAIVSGRVARAQR